MTPKIHGIKNQGDTCVFSQYNEYLLLSRNGARKSNWTWIGSIYSDSCCSIPAFTLPNLVFKYHFLCCCINYVCKAKQEWSALDPLSNLRTWSIRVAMVITLC